MKKTLNRIVLVCCILVMAVGGLFFLYENNPHVYNTLAQAGIDLNILDSLGKWEGELSGGEYYTFVDETGRTIDQTAHEVYIGDELILEDNNRYKVTSVDMEKKQAACQLVGQENIAYQEEWDQIPVLDVAAAKNQVAIYSTHTDESYVPTDGTESKPGKGGIKQVSNAFAQALKGKGITTNISFNNHDPHDANAYHRSRKTAAQLLKTNPIAIIDVHRDGVPDPNFYKTTVKGQPGTKVRLVVGRQNPHMSSNLEFAKQTKAYFDKNYPGLIKGIFMAKGNYNQDLSPRAMLIEVGTHTNSREAAEKGVALFADGLPKLLGIAAAPGAPAPTAPPAAPAGRGTSSALIWLVLVVLLGGGLFLLISTGSFKGSMGKLTNLGREFANYFGPSGSKDKNKK